MCVRVCVFVRDKRVESKKERGQVCLSVRCFLLEKANSYKGCMYKVTSLEFGIQADIYKTKKQSSKTPSLYVQQFSRPQIKRPKERKTVAFSLMLFFKCVRHPFQGLGFPSFSLIQQGFVKVHVVHTALPWAAVVTAAAMRILLLSFFLPCPSSCSLLSLPLSLSR